MENYKGVPTIKVRLYNFHSVRHYGGREITTSSYICNAIFIKRQADNTNLVQLTEACAGFNTGHLIAINDNDFNI